MGGNLEIRFTFFLGILKILFTSFREKGDSFNYFKEQIKENPE
jgi:hypothetical protein